MVDDGSTDSSAAIAAALRRARPALPAGQPAQRRAQRRAQHRHRRTPRGECLAFVDSDDVLAAERLRAAARRARRGRARTSRPATSTGSPRGHRAGAVPGARVRADAARRRTSPASAPLLADRTAWNKLWRRSFWDAHGCASPRAGPARGHPGRRCRRTSWRKSVDVIAEPVYYWRVREGGDAVDHPAPARAARAARPAGRRRGGQRATSPATGRAGRSAGTTRASSPTTCATTSTSLDRRRRRVPRAVPRARQRVPRRRGDAASTGRCRRSSGSSGTSCAAA